MQSVVFMEASSFPLLKPGRQLLMEQGVWVQMHIWITPMQIAVSAAQQVHSPVISLRSSGPLSRNQLPQIWSHMKSLSCHCSRVKLTTAFEPTAVLDTG